MSSIRSIARRRRFRPAMTLVIFASLFPVSVLAQGDDAPRPMTFLDVQEMRRAGSWAISPDGQWMLYTVTTPDWQEASSQSDIHLVSLADGLPSRRQMTFTDDKNETSPTWSAGGDFFVFASNRDATGNAASGRGGGPAAGRGGRGGGGGPGIQLYMMRRDGGEARKITDESEGVRDFQFSPDGAWLVYRSGSSGEEQLYRLPIDGITDAEPEKLTDADAGVQQWDFTHGGDRIYFVRPDAFDDDEKRRREARFTVDIKNMETPLSNLWALDLDPHKTMQLTEGPDMSVSSFTVSRDDRWVGLVGGSPERYERNITGAGLYSDLYLLEAATGHVERLTENYEIRESGPSFSPDGKWIAYGGPEDMTRYTMTNSTVYVREVDDRGGAFRRLGNSWDNDIRLGFWSMDGGTMYFSGGVRVTTQLHALDIETGAVRQVTEERAVLSVSRDEDTGVILLNYADPMTPNILFKVARLDRIGNRSDWLQLTDPNPQVRGFALGEEREVSWTSTDGKEVGGILVYPVGYQEGRRYPLIVAIHGGPASADVLRFNGGSGAQVYAGAGYAILKPNYRGSRNYGNAHRTDIVGDYFTLGFDDIMTGVDMLIEEGIVDRDRMGALGWSAGGHWSNWILTHTDRFKAISSGAGTMNWISMYAQSDVQRNRQFYIGDDFLYENFEPYWNQSPLKYIAAATTPTMVHVVEGDPRVPSPQSVELHMALKKLGVDTELFMYPGRSHGIPDPRNRLVKAVSEMAWMDYYVRGMGEKFQWRDVLKTLKEEEEEEEESRPRPVTDGGGA